MKSVDVGLDEQHQPSGQRYPARDWQLHISDRKRKFNLNTWSKYKMMLIKKIKEVYSGTMNSGLETVAIRCADVRTCLLVMMTPEPLWRSSWPVMDTSQGWRLKRTKIHEH